MEKVVNHIESSRIEELVRKEDVEKREIITRKVIRQYSIIV